MLWGMGLLAAGSIVLGVAPQLAVNAFLNPILGALGMGAGVHVTWFGLSADAGSFSTGGGLVLALVSLVVGGVIYAVACVANPVPAAGRGGAGGRGWRSVHRRRAVGRSGAADGRRFFRDFS